MPTRSDQAEEKRDWNTWTGMHSLVMGLAPGEPVPAPPLAPSYAVTFLDRWGRAWLAPRRAQIDALPLRWVRMEPGPDGYLRRTWVREDGDLGPVYREIAPVPFAPPAFEPRNKKGRRVKAKADADPEEEPWDGDAA